MSCKTQWIITIFFTLSINQSAAQYARDGRHDTPRGFPNSDPVLPPPNLISQQLFQLEDVPMPLKSLRDGEKFRKKIETPTTLFMTFGQFLDHDVAVTPHASCEES